MAKNVGIDLGTTNVLVNLYGKGIILNEPSVVAIDTRSQEVIAIGHEAYEMMGRTPESIQVIQPLKGGVIADFDIAEAMLMLFMQRLNLTSWFAKPNVLICAPSKVSEIERLALIETVERAGGGRIYLEEEPKVAGVGAGIDPLSSSGSMVIDIGGGTSDIAVLSMGSTVTSRSIKLAGDNMDFAISEYIKDKYQLIIGERTAEAIKMSLGSAVEVENESDMIVKGRDMTTGLPKTVTIYTNEIYNCLKEMLDTIGEEARLVLEATPPELAGDIIERGVMVTGGGALINGIDRMLSEKLQVPVMIAENPLQSVAIGTGILLNRIKSERGIFAAIRRIFSAKKVVMNPTAHMIDDERTEES